MPGAFTIQEGKMLPFLPILGKVIVGGLVLGIGRKATPEFPQRADRIDARLVRIAVSTQPDGSPTRGSCPGPPPLRADSLPPSRYRVVGREQRHPLCLGHG